ncbi:hypothetical protein QTP86_002957, partial [Hemibagrus guttatus]
MNQPTVSNGGPAPYHTKLLSAKEVTEMVVMDHFLRGLPAKEPKALGLRAPSSKQELLETLENAVATLQMGIMNSSSDNHYFLEVVKACVHSAMFVAMCVFMYVIKVMVHGSLHLHHEVHHCLLLQHCICLMGFNLVGSVIHSIRSLHFPARRLTCWILFDLQMMMGSGITLTLTLMCMCMCLSVCFPLHYKMLVSILHHWMTLAAWVLALYTPLVFTVVAFAQEPWHYLLSPDSECTTALEGKGLTVSSFLLLFIMMLLIFLSYVLICLKGHHAGLLTILVHVLQIGLSIVTAFTVIFCMQQAHGEIITFLIFSISQVLGPVIYSLRCKELDEEMPQLFPRCCNRCVTQESSVSVEQRGSPGTLRHPSVAVISTGTSHCTSSITAHVSVHESDNENK